MTAMNIGLTLLKGQSRHELVRRAAAGGDHGSPWSPRSSGDIVRRELGSGRLQFGSAQLPAFAGGLSANLQRSIFFLEPFERLVIEATRILVG